MHRRISRTVMAAIAAICLATEICPGAPPEVSLTDRDFKKLDTFEAVVLRKADKAFGDKEYRRAAVDYDSFITQFPRSVATPYALLRKGRSLQLDDKRYAAIKIYTEIMDYFPNAVDYAGAALYFIGDCHWKNGDPAKAIKAWAEQAQDEDYRKHPLAAGAINRLADQLVQQEKWNEAVEYYKQVAVDYRKSHHDAACAAIGKVQVYLVRIAPDEAKLREFYDKAEGFDRHPHDTDENDYWTRVIGEIDARSHFSEADRTKREDYYRYWAGAMADKHAKWDDFQIAQARYQYLSDGDEQKWMDRLDRQFADYQEEGDYSRIVKWITLYAKHETKLAEYYTKLSFEKMKNEQIVALIQALYESGNVPIARNAIPKLKADRMSDDKRESLGNWIIRRRDAEGAKLVFASMADHARGTMGMVRGYQELQMPEPGLKIVGGVLNEPRYAEEAYYTKGQFHQWLRQWAEAIAAYRQSDSPPKSSFRIAECFLADGKRDAAIVELREIENFFRKNAPEASQRIAYAYRDTGAKKLYIAELRRLITKYRESPQSSTAHQQLESMGIKPGRGGVDAD